MSNIEGRFDEVDHASTERTLKFVLTLIVATLIVAVAVTVLSGPLTAKSSAAERRAATVTIRAHP
jgi:hypothetical protein